MNSLVLLTVLAISSAVVSGDLRCIDCGPKTIGNCQSSTDNPVVSCADNSLKLDEFKQFVQNVQDEKITPKSGADTAYSCYSLYLSTNITDESISKGVYRGCIKVHPSISDVCEFLAEEAPKKLGKVVGCKSCKDSACNKDVVPNGASSDSKVYFGGLASLVVALYVFRL